MLQTEELEHYKKILIQKKKETMGLIESLKEGVQSPSSPNDNGSMGFSFHMADIATDAMEKEKEFLLISRQQKLIKQINTSLQSIELGEYGICRVCGEEIARERLEAVPTTRVCISCKNGEKVTQKN
jgi:DnaK suppressor protein